MYLFCLQDVYAYARETGSLKQEPKLEACSNQTQANRKVSPSQMGDNIGTITAPITEPRTTVTGVPNKFGKIIYPDSHKLFVGNLFSECKDDLLQVFSEYGEVTFPGRQFAHTITKFMSPASVVFMLTKVGVEQDLSLVSISCG